MKKEMNHKKRDKIKLGAVEPEPLCILNKIYYFGIIIMRISLFIRKLFKYEVLIIKYKLLAIPS